MELTAFTDKLLASMAAWVLTDDALAKEIHAIYVISERLQVLQPPNKDAHYDYFQDATQDLPALRPVYDLSKLLNRSHMKSFDYYLRKVSAHISILIELKNTLVTICRDAHLTYLNKLWSLPDSADRCGLAPSIAMQLETFQEMSLAASVHFASRDDIASRFLYFNAQGNYVLKKHHHELAEVFASKVAAARRLLQPDCLSCD